MRDFCTINAAGQEADVNISSCENALEGTEITPLTEKGKEWFEGLLGAGATSIKLESGIGISIYWYEKIQAAGLTIAVGTGDLYNQTPAEYRLEKAVDRF
jgi:hypothetical protein